MKLAICIINWNGFEDTTRCLASLARYCKEGDILLLENGSGEEGRLRPLLDARTRLFVSPANLGFAGGCNLLLREALDSGYAAAFLLNNDAEVTEGFLAGPMEFLARPEVGFVQSKLLLAGTDRLENAGHRHLNSGDVIPEGRGRPASAYTANREVLSGCGAALFLKAAMLRDVGLFDESFFLGYEDVDLTYRAAVRGWRGIFCASSVVSHRLNASIDRVRDRAYYVRSQRNALKAYLYNTPWPVIALNLPWIAIKGAGIILYGLFSGKWWLIGIYGRALLGTLATWFSIRNIRRDRMSHRRVVWWRIWCAQHNGLSSLVRLLRMERCEEPIACREG